METNFYKTILRRLRLIKIDRNFLVFLVFLAISIIFWFMQSIKETTELTLTYELKIEDQPQNIIYTSEMPSEVTVIYTTKGWNAFYYKFMKDGENELSVNFKDISRTAGKLVIDANIFRRAVLKKKPQGMSYKATSPSKVEVFYSTGQHKRVPIVFNGHVTTTSGRYLCGTTLTPDSADVYAPNYLYESINSIKTENITFEDLQDTTVSKIALLVPKGVKVVPDSTTAQICVDIFTDKTLQIPIYSENVPKNKIMRTFPLKAAVTFLVSATLFDEITEDKFLLVVDYKETATNAKRCKLYLRQQPENIRHLRISPESVEYVIEQVSE